MIDQYRMYLVREKHRFKLQGNDRGQCCSSLLVPIFGSPSGADGIQVAVCGDYIYTALWHSSVDRNVGMTQCLYVLGTQVIDSRTGFHAASRNLVQCQSQIRKYRYEDFRIYCMPR